MADTAVATPVVEAPVAPVATPEVKEETPVVEATPVEKETVEAEPTFSTAVEPSDAPVLNGDGSVLEAKAEEPAIVVVEETTTEAIVTPTTEEAPVAAKADKK
ncbi:hypothetical protein CPB97_009224, partial [Podila verticillata]